MFIKLNKFVDRINHTLEQVIVPKLDDPFARAQAYAVVEMLNQMVGKIDYKPEILKQQIEANRKKLEEIADKIKAAGLGLPEDLDEYLKRDVYEGLLSGAQWLRARDESDAMLCKAIDAGMDAKDKLGPEAYHELEQGLLKFFTNTSYRDIGMMKPPNIQRIYGRQEDS